MATTLTAEVEDYAEINLINNTPTSGGVSEPVTRTFNYDTIEMSTVILGTTTGSRSHVHTMSEPQANFLVVGFITPNAASTADPCATNVQANGEAMTKIGEQDWGYFTIDKRTLALWAHALPGGYDLPITITLTQHTSNTDLYMFVYSGYCSVGPAIIAYGQNNPSGFDDGTLLFEDVGQADVPAVVFGVHSNIISPTLPKPSAEQYLSGDPQTWSVWAGLDWGSFILPDGDVSSEVYQPTTGVRTLTFDVYGAIADQVIWVMMGDNGDETASLTDIDITVTGITYQDDIKVTVEGSA